LGVLRKIFGSLDWWKLVPNPAVLAGKTEALALRSTAGDAVLIYLSNPAAISVRTDKITAAGPVAATWIDPRSGERTQAGMFTDKGASSFVPPFGWEDALLLLKPAKL
jgi:hypothetical protein